MHRFLKEACRTNRTSTRMVHVNVIRALEDNFMYVVRSCPEAKTALVVDPVEPAKLAAFANENKFEIVGALVTHHHWDHAGGTPDLRKMFPDAEKVPILGGDERIEHMTRKMAHEESCELTDLKILALSTPCHTRGHICYFVENADSSEGSNSVVFTGDTLFVAGCGKFFEGTAPEMHRNLNEVLSSLPNDTLVYPGHEYTTSNLMFAASVEPNNKDIVKKLEWATAQRDKDEDTVPSSIGEEKQINPFMRVAVSEEIQKAVKTSDVIEGMKLLREAKNRFRANI